MADLNFDAVDKQHILTGDWGNLIAKSVTYEFAAASINDVAALCKVPANCEVVGILWASDDLGTSVTLDLGYRAVDGSPVDDDAFLAAEDVATAAAAGFAVFHPVSFTEDAYITGTIEGGAATGTLSVTVLYRFDNK